MGIPTYNELYIPVLNALADGEPRKREEIADFAAQKLGVTPEERQFKVSPTSKTALFSNRLGWVYGHLKCAGLIADAHGKSYQLTDAGKQLLDNPPQTLDMQYLKDHYPAFKNFYNPNKKSVADAPESILSAPDKPPEERMAQAQEELNNKLADDLLERIMQKDPWFFERLVVDLLLAMGYGGADPVAGIVTKKTGDGGIDGMIRQDKLGFDRIYIQAKRYKPDSSVHKPDIQQFYGALSGANAQRGLFITTAKFSQGAIDYAQRQRIVLIDGERLTRLMIEYNVGVSAVAKYEIKAIDSDFFNDENG